MSGRRVDGVDLVFVVGCPRSGTSWVQLLLARHPAVVTTQETHLFQAYLGPLYRRWQREMRAWRSEELAAERGYGLSPILDSDDFEELCRGFARQLFDRILAGSPDAGVVIEKTPGHVFHLELIARLFPGAALVEVIRDPRDVVASLRRASASWWGRWAPSDPAEGARWWRKHVEAGLAIPDHTDRHATVRYERLQENAAYQLARLLDRLGLEADATFCREAAESCRLERLRGGGDRARRPGGGGRPPAGFYGQGQVGGWKDALSTAETIEVERVAGDLMRRLGYEPLAPDGTAGHPPRAARGTRGSQA